MTALSALMIWLGSLVGAEPCDLHSALVSLDDSAALSCPADPPPPSDGDEDDEDDEDGPPTSVENPNAQNRWIRLDINNGL